MRSDRQTGEVFYRLTTANIAQCPDQRMVAGWGLHAESQYHSDLRPALRAGATVDGDVPSVAYVVPEGAAANAGVVYGDLIRAVNGRSLLAGGVGGEPQFEGSDHQSRVVEEAIQSGPARLTLQREGQVLDLWIMGRRACAYDLQVDPSPRLDSRANGERVFITTGLLAFAANDNELAFILGHELAHNILKHHLRTRALQAFPWRGRAAEDQADRLGLLLAYCAGFDIDAAPEFWRRFSAAQSAVGRINWAHPSPLSRARDMEVEARRIRGDDGPRALSPCSPG